MHMSEGYSIDRTIPFFQQNLIGHASNYYPSRSPVRIFGKRINVNNIRLSIWEGPTAEYVPPASGIQLQVSSTSAEDSSSGTGVQQLHIHYLNSNYEEASETVILNGITPVNTILTDALRINNSHAWTVGSTGGAVGNISIKNTSGTITYDYISAGYTSSRTGFYTVPVNKNLYISHWQSSSGSAGGNHFTQMSLRATTHLGILLPNVFIPLDDVGTQDSGTVVKFPFPIMIPSMADVKLSVVADTSNAAVTALGAFMGWLE